MAILEGYYFREDVIFFVCVCVCARVCACMDGMDAEAEAAAHEVEYLKDVIYFKVNICICVFCLAHSYAQILI